MLNLYSMCECVFSINAYLFKIVKLARVGRKRFPNLNIIIYSTSCQHYKNEDGWNSLCIRVLLNLNILLHYQFWLSKYSFYVYLLIYNAIM